jgi:hypothetical protein
MTTKGVHVKGWGNSYHFNRDRFLQAIINLVNVDKINRFQGLSFCVMTSRTTVGLHQKGQEENSLWYSEAVFLVMHDPSTKEL